MRLTVFLIPVICIVLFLVSSGCVGNTPSAKGSAGLKEYRDSNNLFSLNIPEHWTVSVGDAIVAADSSDGGVTKVTIQPVHLSGKYLRITAGEIANYLIGKERRGFTEFSLDSVRASRDGKVLELTGWNTLVLPGCSGLIAADSTMPRGVVFLNGLHQSVQPLPQGVTPERYVTDYMAQDFSVGGNSVSEVKILFYENADISALNTGGITAKSMRISYVSNGVPCTGSFTVATYQTGVSTAVAYLWGIYSTSDNFLADAPDLLRIFYSIDYGSSALSSCRNSLNTAWAGANKVGDTIRRTGEQMRQENLRLYEDRQARNDEFLEKFSDSILDRDRVYNPDTGEVYEVDPNFYAYYDINRDQYNYQNMRELQPGEWLKYTPLDGNLHIQ